MSNLLYLSVGADDEGQAVGELAHEWDVQLGAVQVGHVRSDVRQEGELEVVRLLEVEVLRNSNSNENGKENNKQRKKQKNEKRSYQACMGMLIRECRNKCARQKTKKTGSEKKK